LGQFISVPTGGPFTFDLRQGGLAAFLAAHSQSVDLTRPGGFVLEPQKFILAQTLERVKLPLFSDRPPLAARIEGKSSCARTGILVHFTAPTVHAGWDGPLTLEMINLGPASFALWFGQPICQLILEEVDGVPFANPSQFQGQRTPPGTGT
jgi:dCTP deaminase